MTSPMTAVCVLRIGLQRHRAAQGAASNAGNGQQPPDLDELWRDLNRKLGSLFGGKNGSGRGPVEVQVAAFSQI